MHGNFGLFWNLVGNNAALFQTTDIIETSVYRMVLSQNNFTTSTAVGLYQSLFGFALVMTGELDRPEDQQGLCALLMTAVAMTAAAAGSRAGDEAAAKRTRPIKLDRSDLVLRVDLLRRDHAVRAVLPAAVRPDVSASFSSEAADQEERLRPAAEGLLARPPTSASSRRRGRSSARTSSRS